MIINTLVQTLIKPATNYRGLVQLAAAVSSVTEQLSGLVNDITCSGSEITVGLIEAQAAPIDVLSADDRRATERGQNLSLSLIDGTQRAGAPCVIEFFG